MRPGVIGKLAGPLRRITRNIEKPDRYSAAGRTLPIGLDDQSGKVNNRVHRSFHV